jgi:elongation factor P
MATYSTSEFKSGLKLVIDGIPYTIIDHEFVKPGKGQAFTRIKIRNLKNNRVIEKTYKSGETVEAADINEVFLQYLYAEGDVLNFMDQKTYEQYEINQSIIGDSQKWITEQDVCQVLLWNDEPISVEPPIFVVQEIVNTDPGVKGDTSGGGSKPATLTGGAVVKVPLFVQIGEKIKVDTRTGEYMSRVK